VKKIVFGFCVSVAVLVNLILIHSKIYAASPGTFDCTPSGGVCRVATQKCDPGYKPDLDVCRIITDPNICKNTLNVPCIEDPKSNTVTCQLVHGRAGAVCEPKPGTNDCRRGYIPDCSERSGPECGPSSGLCVIEVPPGGPTIPVYDPGCTSGTSYYSFKGVKTALGCLPTDPQYFINLATPWAVGIGAGIAFLLGVFGAMMIVLSAGNPEKMQAGKEMITSAIGGIILIVFSVFILRVIGVDVLKLFSK